MRTALRSSAESFIDRRSPLTQLLLGGALFFSLCAGALGAERLHGVVLGIDAAHRRAIVRHDAVGDMPGMTMPFRVRPPTELQRLRAGDGIEAEVDRATEPWTLSNIRRARAAVSEALPPVLRRVDILRAGDLVPATRLLDQRGRPFSFADLRGQTTVLAFIYTRCRDARMCPLISSKFHVLQERFRGQPFHLVEVTLDPRYDRPAVMARYGLTFGADPSRWTLATGEPEAVANFDAQFGIDPFPDARVGLIHSERTVIVDRDGRIADLIDETSWSPDSIVAAVRSTARLASNPIARFDLWLSKAAVAVCGNSVAGFSGLTDLLVVLGIFAACAWLLIRLARKIFVENV